MIVKHANPCGVAVSLDGIKAAYDLAYATDTESAFGGIIAFNRELDVETAKAIVERQFVEVIIAPSIADGVLEVTGAKKMFAYWYVANFQQLMNVQHNSTTSV